MTTVKPEVERLAKIDELCQELYEANTMFTPLYPWVFVLVCQKAQQVGGIYLPETQNKPMHEGIVLSTWKDKVFEKRVATSDGKHATRFETKRSEMMVGDHVVFHHSAGQQAWGYDLARFRVVMECDWDMQTYGGGIVGRIEYTDAKTKPINLLREMLDKYIGLTQYELDDLSQKVEERFIVVDREAGSVTLSGV